MIAQLALIETIIFSAIISFTLQLSSASALTFESQLPLYKRNPSFGVTNDTSLAANRTFDYIVIGGGTAGLAVAARLAENPSVTVLVVEAGSDGRTDPRVFDINNFVQAFGTELSWNWETVDGKVIQA